MPVAMLRIRWGAPVGWEIKRTWVLKGLLGKRVIGIKKGSPIRKGKLAYFKRGEPAVGLIGLSKKRVGVKVKV